jgi:DNA-binding beta-propeller fold protein YncE
MTKRSVNVVCAWLSAALVSTGIAAGCGSDKDARPSGSGTTAATVPPAHVTSTVRVGGMPNALSAARKAVWVVGGTRSAHGFLARIDPAANRVTARVHIGQPLGSELACGVAQRGGTAWITTRVGSARSAVVQVASRTNRPTGPPIALPGAACIAAAPSGVFVTQPYANAASISRIDSSSGKVTATTTQPGTFPVGVVIAFGAVWVVDSAHHDLLRLDPATLDVVQTFTLHAGAEYVAAGQGHIWASANDGTIMRIDPRTARASTIRVTGGGRTSLAVGPRVVWVTRIQGPGRRGDVWRVSGFGSRIQRRRVRVGESPVGLATSGDSLWVANYGDGTVSRIGRR